MLQTVQVILWFVGAIVVVSILIDKSPLSLLAGLGASAAILMLVFKDSIMGFVSGVQLSANDMLKVGDWIAMPKYGADGTVIEVTLNTVKYVTGIIPLPRFRRICLSATHSRIGAACARVGDGVSSAP